MFESQIYYIYIDTRIKGTIDQLINYFQANVFQRNSCINVLCKYYKDIAPYIEHKFKMERIPFKFIKNNKDLDLIPNKVVLYLFNAQSNCRVVSNRNLTHIFVSHGESHKLASIKPILRIYDFVITSGQVGVERLLKANIFSINDIVDHKKVIMLGDTFIGKNVFEYDEHANSLLYAPTWEGGVPEENYSSINEEIISKIIQISHSYKINQIYIQPHPNLGHRDGMYLKNLNTLIKRLKEKKFKITLLKTRFSVSDYLSSTNIEKLDLNKPKKKIKCAITDISAMEMQFVYENIPTYVCVEGDILKRLIIPQKIQHLYTLNPVESFNIRLNFFKQHYHYFFSYTDESLENMTYHDRIIWLCDYAYNVKKQREADAFSQF